MGLFLGLGFWSEINVKTMIPAFFGMLIVALILRRLLKDKDERIKNIPFAVIGILLLALEVWKQAWNFSHGYSLYAIPLHFCSLYLYLYPMAHLFKGKVARFFQSLSIGMTSMTFLIFYIYPMMIIGNSVQSFLTDFNGFHTVTYHNLLCFYFILAVALEIHKPDLKKDLKILLIGFTGYFVIAAPMANILNVNFNSFRFGGVAFVEAMRQTVIAATGPVFGQILYLLGVFAGTMAFGIISYLFYYGLVAWVARSTRGDLRARSRNHVSETA